MSTDQTVVSTSQLGSVNTAPAPTPTVSYPATPFAAPAVDPQQDAIRRYEDRVRALMSEKDKAKADYERAVFDRLEAEKRLQQMQDSMRATVEGSTQATQEALTLRARAEAELAKVSAERTKYALLLQHPDLAPYAEFLPATEDHAVLEAAITKLKTLRDADLAKVAAAAPPAALTPQTPPLTSDLFPRNNVPPATPARVAPNAATGATTNDAIKQRLADAAREASLKGDPSIFERAVQDVLPAAQAMARQQV